jgi:2-oxoglutarate dehydrogenase E2 component (dihydrolipoamide succinyltransferase)
MPATQVVMPQLGESVVEGTIARWLVKPGQRVTRDEPLVEVATDKANTEIPSPEAGVIGEIFAAEGAVVPVGGALCSLDAGASAPAGAPPAKAPESLAAKPAPAAAAPAPKAEPAKVATPTVAAPTVGTPTNGGSHDSHDASPVARNVAQEHGLDLAQVQGTGPGGRITKADVLAHIEGAPTAPLVSQPPPPVAPQPSQQPAQQQPPQQSYAPPPQQPQRTLPPPPAPNFGTGPIALTLRAYKPPRYTPKEGDQVQPFDQRRRLIAEHMVYSKATSPHVPCTAEVDMTNLSRRREEWKKAKEAGGKAPSFLIGICRATVQALGEFPRMNAVVQDESLIVRRDVNLGVAVETEKGLLVPVVRRANEKSVLGLARAVDDLAERGRTGKVTADELSGGSFTVSNPGIKGNLFGAAIINQPQVGILRMGEIVKRAVVRTVDNQDAIVIRPMMYLTLSYDHRVIDGVTGNSFLHRVRELVEAAAFTL